MEFEIKDKYDINDLLEIMRILRSEDGCPWDKEQDHHSIRKDFIEEVYEAVEAIDLEDTELLREELGDVLLQVVFHSRIEEEKGSFNFGDVVNEVCQKLVIRHPHVFGDVKVNDSGDVLTNWNNIKQETKGQNTYAETLDSICTALPALMRAQKIGTRAKRAGMDYKNVLSAINALEDEIAELKKAIAEKRNIEEEMGDVLFSAVNVSRLCELDAEEALTRASDKFIVRFRRTEELVRFDGIDMKSLNIDELDAYWQRAKKQ
ncbi:MAG: nucleoside triphosphate pyrophosphohydrolase [Oscillospiraceae bacterium]|nr:nucleoside triphosphate pyrophosphohydrolase [Oscillospiraceae bacterium]